MSQISNESADRKEGEDLSPFELLPREIQLMILKKVVAGIKHFIVFKWFWRLKRVSKKFNSILSSNYAKRHFTYPCTVSYVSRRFVYSANMYILWKSCINEIHDTKYVQSSFKMYWGDLAEYFKNKPFHISYMHIQVTAGGDTMIQTIVDLAKITSGRIDLDIYFVHYNCFLAVGGCYAMQRHGIVEELENFIEKKIIVLEMMPDECEDSYDSHYPHYPYYPYDPYDRW